jgi:hypothetical protein
VAVTTMASNISTWRFFIWESAPRRRQNLLRKSAARETRNQTPQRQATNVPTAEKDAPGGVRHHIGDRQELNGIRRRLRVL